MTSEQVFKEIKGIYAKRQLMASKSISIDTLMLALRITEKELMPFIAELQAWGRISYIPPQPSHSRRSPRLGTIMLVEDEAAVPGPPSGLPAAGSGTA